MIVSLVSNKNARVDNTCDAVKNHGKALEHHQALEVKILISTAPSATAAVLPCPARPVKREELI